MKKFLGATCTILFVLSLTGCNSGPKPLYTWGDYIESSTEYGINGHEKGVLENHLNELEKIINESESNDARVAPGIYAEYAQLLFETNKKEKAKTYFTREKETYPESIVFIDRVIAKLYRSAK